MTRWGREVATVARGILRQATDRPAPITKSTLIARALAVAGGVVALVFVGQAFAPVIGVSNAVGVLLVTFVFGVCVGSALIMRTSGR
jgi:hypothetical protein